MQNIVAKTLLVLYSTLLFGYAAVAFGHKVLHSIENPFHHHENAHRHHNEVGHFHLKPSEATHHTHPHSHNELKSHGHTHDISDHSRSLKALNEQQNQESPDNEAFFFTLTFLEVPDKQLYCLPAALKEGKHLYTNHYLTLNHRPLTPPPNL